jgi:tetratricopeptide (TPR) repeat protein
MLNRRSWSAVLYCAAALWLATGCKPSKPGTTGFFNSNYFKTPYQTESQYIVETVVSDLAEEIYYAAKMRLPEKKYFSVSAIEKPGGKVEAPVYQLTIDLDKQHQGLSMDLNVDGVIWSPEVYRDVATKLAQAAGLNTGSSNPENTTTLLTDLLDGTAETIAQTDAALSGDLQNNFTSPELHEQAALLLGAFLLRDHSGHFFDIRSPLSRMTAHLTMARLLESGDSLGLNGRLANAILLTMVGDQAYALDELNAIDSPDRAVAAMVRALQARNTGDYRPLGKAKGLSRLEAAAWFTALSDYGSAPSAWEQLTTHQKEVIDFVRIANDNHYSVQMGHQLTAVALKLEMDEIQSVYGLTHSGQISRDSYVAALNEIPEGCFSRQSEKRPAVRVIGWGQWAMFLQRHLCYTLQQNFYFYSGMLGMPDYAKQFAGYTDTNFSGLRLYPFLRRFQCTDVTSYHQSVDDGFKATVATPQLVPAQCWNYLCYSVNFAPLYKPKPNPHINEWFYNNPPPGTVYDLHPRLNHPSLLNLPYRYAQLHTLAPYDCRVSDLINKTRFRDKPNYTQAMELYGNMLPWSVRAMKIVAGTLADQPAQYEKLMSQMAEIDPSALYTLADYYESNKQHDKAAEYMDKACNGDPDVVRASNRALWRVRYYLRKGKIDAAGQIADAGAQVYSYGGLEAKAVFLEGTSNYDGAFEWYAKIEERYNASGPLIAFCQRYKAETADSRFDGEVKKREKILFPGGQKKVSLDDFHQPPTDGVYLMDNSDLLAAAGMKKGDVIVALQGTAVHDEQQYTYLRDALLQDEMDLIVWQGDGYHEIKSSPPGHRFGVNISAYRAKQE